MPKAKPAAVKAMQMTKKNNTPAKAKAAAKAKAKKIGK